MHAAVLGAPGKSRGTRYKLQKLTKAQASHSTSNTTGSSAGGAPDGGQCVLEGEEAGHRKLGRLHQLLPTARTLIRRVVQVQRANGRNSVADSRL